MTQTHKEALTDLLAKVEADKYEPNMFCPMWHTKGLCLEAECAFSGSLDAAKALHEAVLPRWTMDQMNEWHADGKSAGWHVCLLKHSKPQIRTRAGEFDMSPARAWLIAILKALIAQEPDQ